MEKIVTFSTKAAIVFLPTFFKCLIAFILYCCIWLCTSTILVNFLSDYSCHWLLMLLDLQALFLQPSVIVLFRTYLPSYQSNWKVRSWPDPVHKPPNTYIEHQKVNVISNYFLHVFEKIPPTYEGFRQTWIQSKMSFGYLSNCQGCWSCSIAIELWHWG